MALKFEGKWVCGVTKVMYTHSWNVTDEEYFYIHMASGEVIEVDIPKGDFILIEEFERAINANIKNALLSKSRVKRQLKSAKKNPIVVKDNSGARVYPENYIPERRDDEFHYTYKPKKMPEDHDDGRAELIGPETSSGEGELPLPVQNVEPIIEPKDPVLVADDPASANELTFDQAVGMIRDQVLHKIIGNATIIEDHAGNLLIFPKDEKREPFSIRLKFSKKRDLGTDTHASVDPIDDEDDKEVVVKLRRVSMRRIRKLIKGPTSQNTDENLNNGMGYTYGEGTYVVYPKKGYQFDVLILKESDGLIFPLRHQRTGYAPSEDDYVSSDGEGPLSPIVPVQAPVEKAADATVVNADAPVVVDVDKPIDFSQGGELPMEPEKESIADDPVVPMDIDQGNEADDEAESPKADVPTPVVVYHPDPDAPADVELNKTPIFQPHGAYSTPVGISFQAVHHTDPKAPAPKVLKSMELKKVEIGGYKRRFDKTIDAEAKPSRPTDVETMPGVVYTRDPTYFTHGHVPVTPPEPKRPKNDDNDTDEALHKIRFVFKEGDKRFFLKAPTHLIKFLELPDKFSFMLGFPRGQKVRANTLALYTPDIRAGIQRFCVYENSGLTDLMVLGDRMTSLLQIVNVDSVPGQNKSENYSHPMYKRVLAREIEDIEIEVKTMDNKYVPFNYGEFIVVLEFKRIY